VSAMRGPWLLVGGLVLGLALGLFYARVVSPVSYANTTPLALGPAARDSYRLMIASAYGADGDLARARSRLALFSDEDPARALAAQAQQLVAQGGRSQDARQLALLAAALKQPLTQTTSLALEASSTALPPTAVPAIPTPSMTPTLSAALALTPFPTATVTATPHAPYVLKKASPVCDPSMEAPLLEVMVRNQYSSGVPGVEAQVTWAGGQDTFYTGLKPQQGPGYGDFAMTPGVTYTLRLGDGGAPVEDLTAGVCPAPTGVSGAKEYAGGVRLEFGAP
jgi:hypothetical protein